MDSNLENPSEIRKLVLKGSDRIRLKTMCFSVADVKSIDKFVHLISWEDCSSHQLRVDS